MLKQLTIAYYAHHVVFVGHRTPQVVAHFAPRWETGNYVIKAFVERFFAEVTLCMCVSLIELDVFFVN